MKYLLKRDEQYHGVMLTMSADLTFWKEGAAYLRTLYEGATVPQLGGGTQVIPAGGIEAVAVLMVYEVNPNEFRTSPIYRARIDFTTYQASDLGGVKAKLKELGLATNLLARASSPVDLFGELSLSGNLLARKIPRAIQLHSQMLRLKYVADQEGDTDLSPGQMYGDEDDLSREQLLYFGFNKQGDNDLGLQPVNGGFVSGSRDTVVEIYPVKENGPFKVEYDLRTYINATNNGQGPEFETVEGDGFLRFVHKNGTSRDIAIIPAFKVTGLGGDYIGRINTGPQSFTEYCEAGDLILLYARYYVHDVGGLGTSIRYRSTITATMQAGSYLRITVESTTPATECRGLLVHEAFQRVAEAIADEPNCFYSEYFGRTDSQPAYTQDGPGGLRLLTNGFGLRGFPLNIDAYTVGADGIDPRKALTATWLDLFNSFDSIDCLGVGLEQRQGQQTLRVEPRRYFYQAKEVLKLGTVQGLAKAPYNAGIFNEVHIGYNRWQSGAAVGLDEFNGQRTYSLPITQLKATYSQLSSIIGAGYVLEESRRQPFVVGTNKEGQADQELFVVSLLRTPTQDLATEKNEAFSSVAGILDPNGGTSYNLRLSPGRMLKRHGFWLRAGLVPQALAGKKMLLNKVEGNDKLVSQLVTESAPVDEHASPLIADLDSPLFVAETYDFDVKLRRHQVRQLALNPYGLISFLDAAGTRKRGYLLSMECAPESGQASLTLLRA